MLGKMPLLQLLLLATAAAAAAAANSNSSDSSMQSFLREPFDQVTILPRFPMEKNSMLDAHISHIHSARVFEHFQKASVGEHVTLPCRVVGKRGVLQWTRDDFGLGNDRDLTGFRRYTMTGSDEEGKEEKGIPCTILDVYYEETQYCTDKKVD